MTGTELTSMSKTDSTALKENYDKQIKILKISSNAVTELKELKKRFYENQNEEYISYDDVPNNDEILVRFVKQLQQEIGTEESDDDDWGDEEDDIKPINNEDPNDTISPTGNNDPAGNGGSPPSPPIGGGPPGGGGGPPSGGGGTY